MRKTWVFVVAVLVMVAFMLPVLGFGAQKAAKPKKVVKFGQYDIKVPNKDPKKLEIAVVYMNITHAFAGLIKQGVDAAAKEFKCNAYITGPTDWATEAQYKVIEDLVTKGVDGMSIAVLDIPGLTPVIQKSLKAGIPTTCFNVDAPESGRLSFTGEDLYLAGAETAKALIEHMGESGKILISSVAVNAIWSQKREMGARSVLSKYPGIEVVELVNAAGDEQTAYATLENAFLAHPDLDGMLSCGGTQDLWGRMMKNKNIGNIDSDKPIYTTGHDLFEEQLVMIKDGWATVSFGQNPYEQGYQAVKQVYMFLTTGDPKSFKDIDTGVFRVDRNNIDKVLQMLYDGKPIG
jgi:ABC-type sugar transport system substrate-binding protein